MLHRLTDQEGQALGVLALALRPDWVRNNPGRVFWQANQAGGIAPAADYAHCVLALLAYCRPEAGRRTPDLWALDGPHWRTTAAEPERRPVATGTKRAIEALELARRIEEQEHGGTLGDGEASRQGSIAG